MASPFDDINSDETPQPDDLKSMPQEDRPPRRSRSANRDREQSKNAGRTPRTAPKSLSNEEIHTAIFDTTAKLGTGMFLLATMRGIPKMQYDGAVIAENANLVADAVVQACEKSPKFKRTIERFSALAGYSILGATIGSVVIPIAWNHGLVPEVVNQQGFVRHPKSLDVAVEAVTTEPDAADPVV